MMAAPAIEQDVAALVVMSGYTSVERNVADSIRAILNLPPFPFAPLVIFFGERLTGVQIGQVRPVERLAQSSIPVLIVHGADDATILARNAYELYAAAAEPKFLYVVPGGGHAGLLQHDPEGYAVHVAAFLQEYLVDAP
jgi:hypothetical protein